MKKLIFLLICTLCIPLHADFVRRNGQWMHVSVVATLPASEHFNRGLAAYMQENWKEAACQLEILTENFSCGAYSPVAYLFLGVAYFQLCEYECASEAISNYLKLDPHPEYLKEAVEFKLAAAEAFRNGARARLFGYRQCPKWGSGYDLALSIYDEVIAALPSSDLAACALFSKGALLCEMRDYRCSVDAFLTLIRRFPKHELAPESFLAIAQVYYNQAQMEFQNPDLLVLAQLNLSRFAEEYPNDDRLEEARIVVCEIEEIYACGLYKIGCFYERTGQPGASVLYYVSTISQFPETRIAQHCQAHLCQLTEEYPSLYVP